MMQAQSHSILDQLLGPVGQSMTHDFAQELLELRASPQMQAMIDDLADKCNEGQLTADEREDYENIVQAIHLIGILQKKARKVVASSDFLSQRS
jgi:hypothetical protein